MDIVSRTAWGARPPKSRIATTWGRRTEFVVHHSEGPPHATVRSIQNFHMDVRGWNDIAYNFLVRDDGMIYEGRGWLVVGAHATGHNTSGIGVCYLGYNAPTDAAKASIRALYDYACGKTGHALLKKGHGQLSQNSTDCPGSALLAWVKGGMTVEVEPQPPATVPPWPRRVLIERDPEMHGDDVLAWQRQMKKRGWSITVDGFYGEDSADIAETFQREKNLTIDRKVGAETWAAAWSAPVT
jgi:peptidoglycan hydrolase-like protein with peptidoglycan-binding domain